MDLKRVGSWFLRDLESFLGGVSWIRTEGSLMWQKEPWTWHQTGLDVMPTSATSKLSGLGHAISPQWIRLCGIANGIMCIQVQHIVGVQMDQNLKR